MPSYNAQTLNYDALNANQCEIMLGDVVVAYAQTTSHSADAGAQQLYGIGSPKPQEIQQLRISPSISVEYFELTQAGINLLGTGTRLIYSLFNTQLDIHIVDGQSNQPIATYVSCVMSSFTETITTNAVVLATVPFLAMDILDNTGKSILNSNAVYSIPALVAAAAGGLGIA